jgi:AcrR family transcriptional regulator
VTAEARQHTRAAAGAGRTRARDDRPPRGRQAEAARNDRLVLEAAREVFVAQGFDAPVSAVAERAGVGMGSLYRRYGSKVELLQHLCELSMEQSIEAARDALAAADAWSGLATYVRTCATFGSGALADVAGRIPVTARMLRTSRRSRALLIAVVARAHGEGTLRSDVTPLDVAWLIEQLARRGAGRRDARDDNVRERLIAIALDGLRATDRAPLPGRPPTAAHYAARWKTTG